VPAYGPQNDVTLKMPAFEWVHVQLHQQKGMISLSPPTICNSAKFSDVTVDLAARVIHRGEEEVHLTPIEFRLLAVLLNNAGKVLTQRQLLNQVWGPNAVEHSHYLRIYMGHLRQKLEQDPARPRHFITETGIGYRFML
ncbi:winged helix-turn-helix domain-containing protein, partial [Escherichia coli]|uniref:winged helix-turn-helix domain-containing protein n=1 Tax=Escherichia coli TaxID=562 RepID=UPI0028DACFDB